VPVGRWLRCRRWCCLLQGLVLKDLNLRGVIFETVVQLLNSNLRMFCEEAELLEFTSLALDIAKQVGACGRLWQADGGCDGHLNRGVLVLVGYRRLPLLKRACEPWGCWFAAPCRSRTSAPYAFSAARCRFHRLW
jgi:hypothetical protein